ncbi:MAG: hypothetical protein QOI35_2155 [Cryptosporangiaceae bacterium]|jgi:hypothetical protein|nr:hypothetical protein [Cryptosporangiaceae bacterium]
MSTTASSSVTVRLHRLTMVAEDGGVMTGRPDTGSYAWFPAEGAELLRRLAAGTPVADAVRWYEEASESELDVADFLDTIGELGFVLGDGEDPAPASPVRWQRLGAAVFSWPAMAGYAVVIVAALVAMIRDPSLWPVYRHLFFTGHPALIPVVLTLTGIGFVLVHEWCHMLAGRRLGLPSTLSIGRRFYYLVAETRLDSLMSVPRRRRYLPFLAGMLCDTVLLAALTLLGAALRSADVAAWIPKLCLALAFTNVLRLMWQFLFYLETDLYYVIATAMRCTQLQVVARHLVASRVRRLLGRPSTEPDPGWSDRDRAAARWYAPLLVGGYAFSLASLIWVGIPTFVMLWSAAAHEVLTSNPTVAHIADGLILLAVMSAELGLLLYVTVRDWRARRRTQLSLGATP